MHPRQLYLIGGLAAAIAGCSARAEAERRPADEPGDIRVSKEAIQSLLTPARQVNVVGTSKVSVVPDVAEIFIGVTLARPTAPEAVAANNLAMAGLVEAIKKRGVAPKDIQTSQVSISPQYSRPAEAKPDVPAEATVPKVVGYEVGNTVRVTVRDLARIGDLVEAATNAGSNQLYGISFRIDDREAVMADLRGKAFDSAKQKAGLYVKRSGTELGPVVQITESDAGWAPAPQPMAFGMAPMMAPAPASPSMPISPGEQEVSLSVSVSYELRSPK